MAAGSATLSSLPTFGPDGELHVVIETPKGSRHKYAYEPDLKTFKLKTVLPEGLSFPYDFGMVPSTKGEDGDPLDVLLLLDAPAFAGCLIAARLIGVVEADQRERDENWAPPTGGGGGARRSVGFAGRVRERDASPRARSASCWC